MIPEIVEIEPKKLVGAKIFCSVANDKTGKLWQKFMPKRKQIENRIEGQYYSVKIFEGIPDFKNFTEDLEFEKWAAVEVSGYGAFPTGLEKMELPGGKYAVFVHHGLASDFTKTMEYIFVEWLPNSKYQLDERPHFEIMGEKYYGPTDANSEEEIWIPIR